MRAMPREHGRTTLREHLLHERSLIRLRILKTEAHITRTEFPSSQASVPSCRPSPHVVVGGASSWGTGGGGGVGEGAGVTSGVAAPVVPVSTAEASHAVQNTHRSRTIVALIRHRALCFVRGDAMLAYEGQSEDLRLVIGAPGISSSCREPSPQRVQAFHGSAARRPGPGPPCRAPRS